MRFQSSDFRLQIGGSALAGVMLAVVCSTAAVRAEMIDRVLAVVAGQLITLSDVNAARDLGLEPAPAAGDPIRTVLTKLIDRALVLAEVDRYAPPEPTTAAVDEQMRAVRERFGSADAFNAALLRSGIDELHLRETLRQNLRMAAYLSQRFAAAPDRRQALIDEWMTGLRRRADVVDLYLGT
jgi:parvulin-like peptidyl-prolyl isomerase